MCIKHALLDLHVYHAWNVRLTCFKKCMFYACCTFSCVYQARSSEELQNSRLEKCDHSDDDLQAFQRVIRPSSFSNFQPCCNHQTFRFFHICYTQSSIQPYKEVKDLFRLLHLIWNRPEVAEDNWPFAKGPTLHLLADFFIVTSQLNGPSSDCAVVTSQWNDVKRPHALNMAKGQFTFWRH